MLAFQNMSGDPEQEYFADGMVAEITTDIARLPHPRLAQNKYTVTSSLHIWNHH